MSADDQLDLPLEWIRGIANVAANKAREPRAKDTDRDRDELPLFDVTDALTDGRPSAKVAARHSQAIYAIHEGKDRHKSTRTHTLALLRLGANGEAGVDFVIRDLCNVFVEKVALERDGGVNEAYAEFQRMVNGAGRLLDDKPAGAASSDEEDPSSSSSPSDTAATPQQSWSGDAPGVAVLPSILNEIGQEVRTMGLVGEENLAKTIYLALTSRLLDKQVSIGVKGHSSSGKSYTVEQVTRFFPPEAFLAFTAMSEKALIYSSEQYANRTIILYEVTAMRENVEDDMTSYFIRSLLSEGRIDYEVVTKDRDGSFTTHRITKEGPTNLVFTTTKTRVHAENETRFLSLSTNDSNEQTANVLKAIARAHNGNDLSRWVEFQRWLASDTAEREVVIPYAEALAELISPAAVRLRRDFSSILALIQAHAVLHQLSRGRDEQGRIVATVEDYDVVRELVADVITEGVGGAVSDTVRQTVEAVRVLMSQDVFRNTSTTKIAAHLKIDKSNAGRRLKVAADGGYVQNLETQRGLAAKWVVGDPLPDEVTLLPEAEVLYAQQPDVHASQAQHRNTSQPPDQDCCGVAPETEGIGNGDADGGEAEEDTAASTPSARSKTAKQTAHRLRMRKKVIARLTRVGANGLYAAAMTDSFGLRGDRGVLDDVLAELVAEKLIAVVGRGNDDKFWVLDQHAARLAQKFHGRVMTKVTTANKQLPPAWRASSTGTNPTSPDERGLT